MLSYCLLLIKESSYHKRTIGKVDNLQQIKANERNLIQRNTVVCTDTVLRRRPYRIIPKHMSIRWEQIQLGI